MTAEEKKKVIKELVLARLYTLPENAVLSVGSGSQYNKEQIINEVEKDSDVGQRVIEVQINYLKLLKEGAIYGAPNN